MGGYDGWPDSFNQKMTDVTEGVTFYKGKHNLRAGFEFRRAWFSSVSGHGSGTDVLQWQFHQLALSD